MEVKLQKNLGRLEMILQDGPVSAQFEMAPSEALRLASELLAAATASEARDPGIEYPPLVVSQDPPFRVLTAPDAVVLSADLFNARPVNLRFSDSNARLIVDLFQKVLAMPANFRGESERPN